MFKKITLFLFFILLSNCSVDTKTGIWEDKNQKKKCCKPGLLFNLSGTESNGTKSNKSFNMRYSQLVKTSNMKRSVIGRITFKREEFKLL